jgi:hypothetical protein
VVRQCGGRWQSWQSGLREYEQCQTAQPEEGGDSDPSF